jgi:hypothetical protein
MKNKEITTPKIFHNTPGIIQSVSAKIFEPNNSVIFKRIFVIFKMRIF